MNFAPAVVLFLEAVGSVLQRGFEAVLFVVVNQLSGQLVRQCANKQVRNVVVALVKLDLAAVAELEQFVALAVGRARLQASEDRHR